MNEWEDVLVFIAFSVGVKGERVDKACLSKHSVKCVDSHIEKKLTSINLQLGVCCRTNTEWFGTVDCGCNPLAQRMIPEQNMPIVHGSLYLSVGVC